MTSSNIKALLSSHHINFGLHCVKTKITSILFSPLTEEHMMTERGQQPSKERWDASQIPVSLSLTSRSTKSDLGNVGITRRAPKLPLCSLPLLLSSFLSEPNGRTPALQCLPYSISAKLSLASHEKQWNFIGDQITKRGGFDIEKCSKGGGEIVA